MLQHVLQTVRQRVHPLHQLRKSRMLRSVMTRIDFSVWITLSGVTHKVRVRAVRNASYLLSRRTIEPEMAALTVALNRVFRFAVFYDVGAHVGFYSWLLRSVNPDADIVMFEPDEVNCRLIRETLSRYPSDRLTLREAAASDTIGTGDFTMDQVSGATGSLETPGSAFVALHYGVRPPSTPVSLVTLDSLREGSAASGARLLKIDVEGHEHRVLRGAERTLLEDRPIVIFEHFDRQSGVLDRLRDRRFQLYDAQHLRTATADTTNFLAVPEELAGRMTDVEPVWRAECQKWIR